MSEYTQLDFDDLVRALRRYVDNDMDQFAVFRIHTNFDDVFIRIERELPPGHSIAWYPVYEPPPLLDDDGDTGPSDRD
jgi:hypothetical protein